VGDRYVAEEMEAEHAILGGEPSGHVIRADLTTTGDGILTGLASRALVAASGKPLAAQPHFVHTPQVSEEREGEAAHPARPDPRRRDGARALREEARRGGRILLRYSGTEPLARVMVEGFDADLVESVAASLTRAIQTQSEREPIAARCGLPGVPGSRRRRRAQVDPADLVRLAVGEPEVPSVPVTIP